MWQTRERSVLVGVLQHWANKLACTRSEEQTHSMTAVLWCAFHFVWFVDVNWRQSHGFPLCWDCKNCFTVLYWFTHSSVGAFALSPQSSPHQLCTKAHRASNLHTAHCCSIFSHNGMVKIWHTRAHTAPLTLPIFTPFSTFSCCAH